MVPKQIHHGNSITGSQLGCAYNFVPKMPAMALGNPLRIATTMKPVIMAEDIARIIPASLREYSAQEHAQDGAVSVTEDAEDDRNDAHGLVTQ